MDESKTRRKSVICGMKARKRKNCTGWVGKEKERGISIERRKRNNALQSKPGQ